eukprot:GHRR01022353.1.p1 GENE.GHRR01022353.1~~GHRR01022353.1.p1  ORF type:complete len:769 (+),score=323.78 GHRR01022353.1:155-2461(+)
MLLLTAASTLDGIAVIPAEPFRLLSCSPLQRALVTRLCPRMQYNEPAPQSAVNKEYFESGFTVDGFLVALTQDVIAHKHGSVSKGKGSSNNTAGTDRVLQLLARCRRAEQDIEHIRHEIAGRLSELQAFLKQDATHFKAEVRTLERVTDRIKEGTRDIDARLSHVNQTATRIGDRLQTAEALRLKCLEAQELVSHLQAFSCHTAGADFSRLPGIFTNDATLPEAAAVSHRLHVLAKDVAAAKQRTKVTAAGFIQAATPGSTGGVGSIEHTLKVLETYCNWLENRVVGRFDAAVADGDMLLQAQSVAIMIELEKEQSIAQRWTASRSLFLTFTPEVLDGLIRHASKPGQSTNSNLRAMSAVTLKAEGSAHSTGSDITQQQQPSSQQRQQEKPRIYVWHSVVVRQTSALATLYKDMLAMVQDDISAAQRVFPCPAMVLEMFLQRLFEQNVQAVLERLLLPRSIGMTAIAAAAAAVSAAAADLPPHDAKSGASAASLRSISSSGGLRQRASSLAAAWTSSAAADVAADAATSAIDQATPAEVARQQLRLLAAAYTQTQSFSTELQGVLRHIAARVDVIGMAEGVWQAFLHKYPEQELSWLAAAYVQQVGEQDSPGLSLPFCQDLISRNKEAVNRALELSSQHQAPTVCRMLFHHLVPASQQAAAATAAANAQGAEGAAAGAAGTAAHPGCLLEQLARHIIAGVEYSLELCCASGLGSISNSIFRMGFGAISKSSSIQMAEAFVNDKIRKALEAARVATQIMTALQVTVAIV